MNWIDSYQWKELISQHSVSGTGEVWGSCKQNSRWWLWLGAISALGEGKERLRLVHHELKVKCEHPRASLAAQKESTHLVGRTESRAWGLTIRRAELQEG